jgi:hypothetical protein
MTSIKKKQNIFIWFLVITIQTYVFLAGKYLSNLSREIIGIYICLLIAILPNIYFNLLIRKENQPFSDIVNNKNMSGLFAVGIAFLASMPLKIFEQNNFSSPYILLVDVAMLFFFTISYELMLSNKILMIIDERIAKIQKREKTDLDEIIFTLQPYIESSENKIIKYVRNIILGVAVLLIIISVHMIPTAIFSNLIFISLPVTFCFIVIIYYKLCVIYMNKLFCHSLKSKSYVKMNTFLK